MNVKTHFKYKASSMQKVRSKHFSHLGFVMFIMALSITITIFSSGHARSADLTLRWDPSDQATGYRLYYGYESRSYDFMEEVGSSVQHTVTDLYDNQRYYFAVIAYNAYGESTFSEELVYEPTVNSQNQPPVIDAGADQTITLPESRLFLDATVTDDGLPELPVGMTTTWSQVSGPATVMFDDAANVDTWARFSAAGIYLLNLEADDGDLTTGDEVTIIVHSATTNQAPHVDAGDDQTLSYPEDGILLSGAATDDGLPDPPATMTTTWSQVSGPGAVYVDDPATADTRVSFPSIGTYVLRLEADDGDLTVSDEVTITVNATPSTFDDGPYLETGVVHNVDNGDWTTVMLNRFYTSMVVVCTPNYDATSPAITVRVDEADGDSFRVRVDRTDGSTALIDGVSIHYMVVEQGVYTEADHGVKMEAVKFLSTATDENNSWTGQSMPYSNIYTDPVVLGQVMTYNDPRYSIFWSCGSSPKDPPDQDNLKVGKTISEDPDNIRFDEMIGYIVIEAGSGNIEGIQYAVALGGDSVRGVDNRPPYNYSLGGLSAPEVAVASVAAMDGANGGWAILYGANPVAAGKLGLAVDEDQSVDSERAHTTEQIGYIVFQNSDTDPAASWVQLTYDDFENGWGSYTDGGRDCSMYTDGTYAHQGLNAVNIQDNSGNESSFFYTAGIDVETPGFTQIEVDFWFMTISMDNSQEDFQVEYYDGSTWHTVASYAVEADFENNVFYHKKVIIDQSNYTFPTDMKIRFVCDASGNRDDVYIDEVKVSAR